MPEASDACGHLRCGARCPGRWALPAGPCVELSWQHEGVGTARPHKAPKERGLHQGRGTASAREVAPTSWSHQAGEPPSTPPGWSGNLGSQSVKSGLAVPTCTAKEAVDVGLPPGPRLHPRPRQLPPTPGLRFTEGNPQRERAHERPRKRRPSSSPSP